MNITTLSKLEVLWINGMTGITDGPLIHLSERLKVLRCAGCKVTDAGLTTILNRSQNIELLELSFCNNITDEIVNYAIELTKQRTNNVILNLIIELTGRKEWEIEKISPFFSLHDSDSCGIVWTICDRISIYNNLFLQMNSNL